MTRARWFVVCPLLVVAGMMGWFVLTPHAVLSPLPSVALAQLPGRGDAGEPGEIICVIIIHANGDRYVDPPGCDEEPPATPWPTYTASATPGWTPVPTTSTATPPATNTPVPTAIPTIAPIWTATPTPTLETTPTPEITLLPTVTSTAPSKQCQLRAAFDGIRIRSGASTTDSIMGSWRAGEYRAFDEFIFIPDGYAWGHSTTSPAGWSVIYDESSFDWWVDGTPGAELCRDVNGWNPYVAPPEPITQAPAAWLIDTVPGYNALGLQASYPILARGGIQFGVKSYADLTVCVQALDAGGLCILRIPVHGLDCPERIGTADPDASALDWMSSYQAMLGSMWGYRSTGRWIIELVNECNYGAAGDAGVVYWWATWIDTAIDYATAHDWPPVVVPTFGPGSGDDPFLWSVWKPAMLKVQAANGLVGFHAYTPYGPDGLCQCDPWQACRHRTNYAAMQAAGLDLGYSITEAARGWGGDPVDEADFACYYHEVERDPGLQSVAGWLGGPHPAWPLANLDGHYTSLAYRITQ